MPGAQLSCKCHQASPGGPQVLDLGRGAKEGTRASSFAQSGPGALLGPV